MQIETALTFDDVLIVPQFSDIESRSDPDISSKLGQFKFKIPIIAASMKSVCEEKMAFRFHQLGGLGVIHRFCGIEKQCQMAKSAYADAIRNSVIGPKQHGPVISAAIGTNGDYLDRAIELIGSHVKIIVIDVAHGHHDFVCKAINNLKQKLPSHIHIMAGNVATADAYYDLSKWGADSVKVGVGPGCFLPREKVKTYEGPKPIEQVKVGEYVLTHKNRWRKVKKTFEYDMNGEIVVVNEKIKCTPQHEFYAINTRKALSSIVHDSAHSYAEWVQASNLLRGHLLMKNLCLAHVNSLKRASYQGKVFDLSVEEDASYNVNGFFVHNSACSTRGIAGTGFPQFSAILNCAERKRALDLAVPIIADGGIKQPGDAAKAIAAGADFVMIGSMFAATKESPGEIITFSDKPHLKFKEYAGSASWNVKKEFSRGKKTDAIEGVSKFILYKGKVHNIVNDLAASIKVALSYSGAKNIEEFQKKVKFVKQTSLGKEESSPSILKE